VTSASYEYFDSRKNRSFKNVAQSKGKVSNIKMAILPVSEVCEVKCTLSLGDTSA